MQICNRQFAHSRMDLVSGLLKPLETAIRKRKAHSQSFCPALDTNLVRDLTDCIKPRWDYLFSILAQLCSIKP